ncbi:F-box/kelch-repeat protein At1g51550 isoform X2 [Rutidosis leptorrhynchoides]|uniref:F-box/kelch-repeat protein At1g51550 isoform X2 n=1 Tax=Rutidosis leptorrhynchoides TaxID=125765 RepID=UPI003A999A3B
MDENDENVESILSFAMTCKRNFLRCNNHNYGLWKSICIRDWGHSTVDAIVNSNPRFVDWHRVYRRLRNLDQVSCFNITTNSNSSSSSSFGPTPRASHSLNFIKGCLLLFAGGSDGGRHLDDTWIGYIGNNTTTRMINWQRVISDGPSGRFGHSCVVIGDSLVLFGGINDSGIRQNDTWIAHAMIDDANTRTFSWRLLDVGPIAPPTRGAHACCSIDSQKMLIHGGIGLSGVRLGDTWVLSLSENLCFGTWHQTVSQHHHPVPSPRSGHTLTYIGGSTTILFGGRGTGYEVLNDVWCFDSSQRGHLGWVPLVFELENISGGGGLSLARVGHSATLTLGGRVLIYGGEDSLRHRKNDFWLLDINSSSRQSSMNQNQRRVLWRRLKCVDGGYQPRSRSFHRACTDESGRYLYVFGGMVDGVLQPAEPSGLRFDGELFVVELVL